MTRDEIAAAVLTELAKREEEITTRPDPAKWKSWEWRELADDREYGPLYSPTWFGELNEAGRVRHLRTVYRLADAGLLVVVKSEGGRLERVQLTGAGKAAVQELAAAAG
jgi:hypothetical protein